MHIIPLKTVLQTKSCKYLSSDLIQKVETKNSYIFIKGVSLYKSMSQKTISKRVSYKPHLLKTVGKHNIKSNLQREVPL